MNYGFDSIAGYETEKEELRRLCEIFNNREKYEKKGAKFPKGIVFYGEAGTGKTLFSKVLASVCGLEVLKIDLGDVENESAICRYIKKTFTKAAKSKSPTMIFFDEMDKVLPNEEEEYQTDRSKTILTQLLTLIDGMDSSNNFVFVATCNDYDVLPETLTRPGRLDKKIGIGLPNYASRVEILNLYARQSTCRFEMTAEEIAKLCSGFSCAALKTLVNECILQSEEDGTIGEPLIRDKISEIDDEDIPRARSQVEDRINACRNVGAFVVAQCFVKGNYELNLEKYTVCNGYFNSLFATFHCGYSVSDYDEDDDYDEDEDYDDYDDDYDDEEKDENGDGMYAKSDFLNAITVLLAGYAAEEQVLNKTYANVYIDFWMIDKIFMRLLETGMFGASMRYSSRRATDLPYRTEKLDAINRLYDETLENCYQQAKMLVAKNVELIKGLITRLAEKTYLDASACALAVEALGGINR